MRVPTDSLLVCSMYSLYLGTGMMLLWQHFTACKYLLVACSWDHF